MDCRSSIHTQVSEIIRRKYFVKLFKFNSLLIAQDVVRMVSCRGAGCHCIGAHDMGHHSHSRLSGGVALYHRCIWNRCKGYAHHIVHCHSGECRVSYYRHAIQFDAHSFAKSIVSPSFSRNSSMGWQLHGTHGHSHGGGGGHAHGENINVRAAFIHVLGDVLQSIGVFCAAIIIYFKPDWHLADPICTFIFSLIVLCTTITIMKDALLVSATILLFFSFFLFFSLLGPFAIHTIWDKTILMIYAFESL